MPLPSATLYVFRSIHRQVAEKIDRTRISLKNFPMTDIICPRSPRETMCGWMHLPRYIDKIRLHLAGKLHKDYQANLGKGFDGWWLEAAGLAHEQFVEIVKGTIIDGQVADWVLKNVKKPEGVKAAHRERLLIYP